VELEEEYREGGREGEGGRRREGGRGRREGERVTVKVGKEGVTREEGRDEGTLGEVRGTNGGQEGEEGEVVMGREEG
jgi:hypothetical protein